MPGRKYRVSARVEFSEDDEQQHSVAGPVIRMDGWRRQANRAKRRGAPDGDGAADGALDPALCALIDRKVTKLPALGRASSSSLGKTASKKASASLGEDPIQRRRAMIEPSRQEMQQQAKIHKPSPWARSVSTKAEKRGRASGDHTNVSAPWRRGYAANETQHLGAGKDLIRADMLPTAGSSGNRPLAANASRSYALYVTYKQWVGPTCYTPMPSTRGTLTTRGSLGSMLLSAGSFGGAGL